MTVTDLLFKIAERAKILANLPLNDLRMRVGTGDTPQTNIRENRHRDRGDLIEAILTDEFEDDAKEIDEKLDDIIFEIIDLEEKREN